MKARLSYDFRMDQYPIQKKADYNLMAAYFNIDNGGGNLGLYVLRKRGTPTAGDTVTNRTTTGSGTIALMGANTPLYQPTGGFVPYSPFPNAGGTATVAVTLLSPLAMVLSVPTSTPFT